MTNCSFHHLGNTYDLWVNETEGEVYDRVRRCFGGDELDTWKDIISEQALNEPGFSTYLGSQIEKIVEDDSHEDQVSYLRKTKKLEK